MLDGSNGGWFIVCSDWFNKYFNNIDLKIDKPSYLSFIQKNSKYIIGHIYWNGRFQTLLFGKSSLSIYFSVKPKVSRIYLRQYVIVRKRKKFHVDLNFKFLLWVKSLENCSYIIYFKYVQLPNNLLTWSCKISPLVEFHPYVQTIYSISQMLGRDLSLGEKG